MYETGPQITRKKNGLQNGNVYFLMTPTVYTSLGGGDETSTKIADPVSPVVVEV